jgi:hypothetical protein
MSLSFAAVLYLQRSFYLLAIDVPDLLAVEMSLVWAGILRLDCEDTLDTSARERFREYEHFSNFSRRGCTGSASCLGVRRNSPSSFYIVFCKIT